MNKQETTQKILDFCQDCYPKIDWEQNHTKSTICIWGKTTGIGISIETIGTRLEGHVVLGDVSAFISSTERWSGSFKIWLDRKESQSSFKSKRELDTSTDLFIKAKDILSSIFEFIETEIQTEVTS